MKKFYETLGGKRVAFIGAGVAHRELITLFARAGAKVTLCDARVLSEFGAFGDELLNLGVMLSLGENYLDALPCQDMVLRTPGFDYLNPELQAVKVAGVRVTSEIELFFEHCPCPTIGVTGSDGKTTTTSLIAAICEAAGRRTHLGGNIGRAMLPVVDTIGADDIAVVELSSFQLISMQVSPDIAVVTNITPNHLDHHRDMEEYVGAKKNILAYQKSGGTAVLGRDNDLARGLAPDAQGALRWFSCKEAADEGAFLDAEGWLCVAQNGQPVRVVHKSEVLLRGGHNVQNLLAAFAAARDIAPVEVMADVARTFPGVEHRIEFVRKARGADWYNDSIATSPTRVLAGLRSFDKKIILIAGGYDKNLPFDPMVTELPARVRLLILTGPTADKIEAATRAHPDFAASGLRVLRAENMASAVELAAANAGEDDVVMLSPACSSFDAYPNFEARGRHFKELVMGL